MKNEEQNAVIREYKVCGTKYTVTSVYKSEAQKEALEDKIIRLILSDKARKA